MMLTIASFPKHATAERLVAFLRIEYGVGIHTEIRLDAKTGRWLVYVDSVHPDWDTIRVISYGFMSGANS